MADITNAAQIGVNQHSYDFNSKKAQNDSKNISDETLNNNEPSKILNSLDAMSVYNQGKINTKKAGKAEGEYKFDPKNVSDDVKDFQETFDIVKDVSSEYMQALINKGYEPSAAMEKAGQFASLLLGGEEK